VLLLLLAARLSMVTFGFGGVILMMSGRAAWSLATNLLLLSLNVGLDVALIPVLGAAGAALAGLVAVLGVKALTALLLRRAEGLSTIGPHEAVLLSLLLVCLGLGSAALLPPLPVAAVLALLVLMVLLRHGDVVDAARRWALGRAA
jgi:O-antigen/teichoic acid export membrane protein